MRTAAPATDSHHQTATALSNNDDGGGGDLEWHPTLAYIGIGLARVCWLCFWLEFVVNKSKPFMSTTTTTTKPETKRTTWLTVLRQPAKQYDASFCFPHRRHRRRRLLRVDVSVCVWCVHLLLPLLHHAGFALLGMLLCIIHIHISLCIGYRSFGTGWNM